MGHCVSLPSLVRDPIIPVIKVGENTEPHLAALWAVLFFPSSGLAHQINLRSIFPSINTWTANYGPGTRLPRK